MYKKVLDNKMPKQSIKYDYIDHCISIVFLIFLYSVFIWLWQRFDWWHFLIYPVTALLVIIIVLGFINPIIRLKRTSFEISEHSIEIQKGLYYQKRSVQPINRIQFIEIEHGPISRRFNIYFVVVVTAGSRIRLPMVNRKLAEETRKKIITKVKEVTDDV